MKNILFLFALITVYNFTSNVDDCKSQWVLKYSGGESIGLFDIKFVNDYTGYIVGGEDSYNVHVSVLLKSTDGGNNWVRINMNLYNDHWLYALSFINENTGFVCGRNPNVRKTTDGGQTWSSYMVTTNTPNFNAIHFLNDQTGYIGGRYGMRARTTNGGVNWTTLDSAYTHIDVIHFFDANTGIMGDAYSGIYRTTNGGTNWIHKYQTDSIGRAFDFVHSSFINDNTGYIIGTTYYSGVLIKTTNKGIDWSVVRTFPNLMASVFALNSSTIYVGGLMPYILRTSDAGMTWTNQNVPASLTLSESIYFINPNTGFSCGSYGSIAKTVNGGVWVNNISTETPSKYSLSQNYPNPFNSTSNLKFEIVNLSNVKIIVYDMMGREVQTLVNERLKPGTYETSFDGSMLNSGVYFYKITSEKFSETKRMLLIK